MFVMTPPPSSFIPHFVLHRLVISGEAHSAIYALLSLHFNAPTRYS